MNMLKNRGAALKGKSLNSFIRMIEASIPQFCLMNINCDVVVEIDRRREIISIASNTRDKY